MPSCTPCAPAPPFLDRLQTLGPRGSCRGPPPRSPHPSSIPLAPASTKPRFFQPKATAHFFSEKVVCSPRLGKPCVFPRLSLLAGSSFSLPPWSATPLRALRGPPGPATSPPTLQGNPANLDLKIGDSFPCKGRASGGAAPPVAPELLVCLGPSPRALSSSSQSPQGPSGTRIKPPLPTGKPANLQFENWR